MNITLPDSTRITTDSIITVINVELFLALPSKDKPGDFPGEHFSIYHKLCQLQAVNIVAALVQLGERRVREYDRLYGVNFPYLVVMLVDDGNLRMDKVTELLVWFRGVMKDEFSSERFVYDLGTPLADRLNTIQQIPERFQKLIDLESELDPLGNDWRWKRTFLKLMQEILPEDSFTRRCVASGLILHYNDDPRQPNGIKGENDFQRVADTLVWSFQKHG